MEEQKSPPLISSVLIIGFVLFLSAIFMIWLIIFANDLIKSTNTSVNYSIQDSNKNLSYSNTTNNNPQLLYAEKSTYSPVSPHWLHINVLDFGRYPRNIRVPEVFEALDFYASHVDVMEVGMIQFSNYGYPEPHMDYIKSKNQNLTTFGYVFDLSMCVYNQCGYLGTTQPGSLSNLPESWYLHFSQDTKIKYYDLNGLNFANITITGCPELSPITESCRVKIFEWESYRYLSNIKNQEWRNVYATSIINFTKLSNPDIDGVFIDEHGPGFSLVTSIGNQNKIEYGGNIREYNNNKPMVQTGQWPPDYNQLEYDYNSDAISWLAYLRSRMISENKFMLVNTAQYFLDDLAYDQNYAAGGVTTEHLHKMDGMYFGSRDYEKLIISVKNLVSNNGFVDLYGTNCYYGPPNYTSGNYKTSKERFIMWRLASYYILKESPSSIGKVYFNPNLCFNSQNPNLLSFKDDWLEAFEVNVGKPTSDPYIISQGINYNCKSLNYDYKVFARNYTKALVLVRPKDHNNCNDFDSKTSINIQLKDTYRLLYGDSSLSSIINSINLRNGESAILIKN